MDIADRNMPKSLTSPKMGGGISRRDVISGLVGAGLVLGAERCGASMVRSVIGARQSGSSISGDEEEEMYKELFEQFLMDRLDKNTENIEVNVEVLRTHSFSNTQSLKRLVINGLSVIGSNIFYPAGSGVEEIILPDLVTITGWAFYTAEKLQRLYVPKLKGNMNNLCWIGPNSVLSDVYITESSCSDIMSMNQFPGMTGVSQNGNYENVVFHGSDGTITYDGSAWVTNPS